MNVHFQNLQDFSVQIDDVTLHLSEYKIVGGCLLQEQGTASGNSAVTACFPKLTRLTLKGRLAPSTDAASAAQSVDRAMHSASGFSLRLGQLVCHDARIIGFSLSEGSDSPEMTLLFVSASLLERVGDV